MWRRRGRESEVASGETRLVNDAIVEAMVVGEAVVFSI